MRNMLAKNPLKTSSASIGLAGDAPGLSPSSSPFAASPIPKVSPLRDPENLDTWVSPYSYSVLGLTMFVPQGNTKYLPKTQLRSNASSNNLTRVLREREYQRAGTAVDKQRISQGCVPNSVGAIVSTVRSLEPSMGIEMLTWEGGSTIRTRTAATIQKVCSIFSLSMELLLTVRLQTDPSTTVRHNFFLPK